MQIELSVSDDAVAKIKAQGPHKRQPLKQWGKSLGSGQATAGLWEDTSN